MLQILIRFRFVHQHNEEYTELKNERRPGRPASVREDQLRMKTEALQSEYEKGFCKDSTFTTNTME